MFPAQDHKKRPGSTPPVHEPLACRSFRAGHVPLHLRRLSYLHVLNRCKHLSNILYSTICYWPCRWPLCSTKRRAPTFSAICESMSAPSFQLLFDPQVRGISAVSNLLSVVDADLFTLPSQPLSPGLRFYPLHKPVLHDASSKSNHRVPRKQPLISTELTIGQRREDMRLQAVRFGIKNKLPSSVVIKSGRASFG